MKVILRPSIERGHNDIGWLQSFHTFSVAHYYDPEHIQFGCLRVINEDRVAPKTGFGSHSHREFEIFSYIVSGELQHGDSMSNQEVVRRGDIQMTSAGTGIRHAEHQHGDAPAHFLQVWAEPSTGGLTPQYFTRHFSDEDKRDQWAHVVAPVGFPGVIEAREASGPTPIHAPLNLFATLLSPGRALSYTFLARGEMRKGYVQVPQTSGHNLKDAEGARVRILGAEEGPIELREGDGAYVFAVSGDVLKFENVGDRVAEVLLFDMDSSE